MNILTQSLKDIDQRLSSLISKGDGSTGQGILNFKRSSSPFDAHKRSRSSAAKGAHDPMATLQRQLQELATQSNSYSIKESFVRGFRERLTVVEGLMQRCEQIVN